MSKSKTKVPSSHAAKNIADKKDTAETAVGEISFKIPYPFLLLVLAVLVVYFPVFSYGFTELDDSIFIKEFADYNEDTHNLIASFGRGLFDAVKDPYYRPLFSDIMILNYQWSGVEAAGYHFVNVLLHIGVVLLLYKFLGRLGLKPLHCFLLSLLFAVHPVLSQAVAWIPGRNDTMLAVFVLLFLIYSVAYTERGKVRDLLVSGIFLLLAFFTKETAVFAAPVAFVILVLYLGNKVNAKALLVQYGVWALCFVIWYAARSVATIQSAGIGAQAAGDFLHRLPVLIQYLGKVLLPFNLSVFPTQDDTVIYFGLVALLLLVAIVFFNKESDKKKVLAGAAIFLLFLMPALLVPNELNQQTFEHRLYLPMIGVLLLLPQTVLFANRLMDKQMAMAVIGVCVVFAVLNNRHQKHFENPLAFWTQAAETSPNSAYANMMLAARLDRSEGALAEQLFRKAYALNPKEKYLNFYMGEMLQKKDSVAASKPYLLKEKEISNYVQCDFYLARVAMEEKDLGGAIGYLQDFLKRDRYNDKAHNNLLILYLETQQPDKAKAHVAEMKQLGLPVPAAILRQLGM